jgi:hypothetical protein
MDMRFGMWNVRSMYRAGSLRTVAEEVFLERQDGMVWSGSNWLRIGTSGGLF